MLWIPPEATFPLPSPVCLSIFHRAAPLKAKPETQGCIRLGVGVSVERKLTDGTHLRPCSWCKSLGPAHPLWPPPPEAASLRLQPCLLYRHDQKYLSDGSTLGISPPISQNHLEEEVPSSSISLRLLFLVLNHREYHPVPARTPLPSASSQLIVSSAQHPVSFPPGSREPAEQH